MKKKIVNCKNFEISNNSPLTLISGPCQMESEKHALNTAEKIMNIASDLKINFIYKTSFDKANRTSLHGKRGIGLENSLKVFKKIKDNLKIPVITDVHDIEQCKIIAEVVDVIQIPAFLCRQTDLLVAASKTKKIINVKKGQFLAPWDMKNVVSKLEEQQCKNILLTDRGTQFGYNNLIADMRAIPIMQKFGYPVVFDATHSAQLPGGDGKTTGGMRDMIPTMARSAVAAGCDGIFMEVHDNIHDAKSDASTQWPLDQLESVLSLLTRIRDAVDS